MPNERIPDRLKNTFVHTNSGQRFRPVYELDMTTSKFVKKGQIDLKEYINSGFIETDLYSLIDRYKTVEDFNSRGLTSAFYGDVSEMPKTMFDLPPTHVLGAMLAEEGKKGTNNEQGGNLPITEKNID